MERPIWIWQGNKELVLLQLVLLLLCLYLLFRWAAHRTKRWQLFLVYGIRLDRMATKAGCSPKERSLLSQFYQRLDQKHKSHLIHNHALSFLRGHMLLFGNSVAKEDQLPYLSMVAKCTGTALGSVHDESKGEFGLLQMGKNSLFVLVREKGGSFHLRLSQGLQLGSGSAVLLRYHHSQGILPLRGRISERSGFSAVFLPQD